MLLVLANEDQLSLDRLRRSIVHPARQTASVTPSSLKNTCSSCWRMRRSSVLACQKDQYSSHFWHPEAVFSLCPKTYDTFPRHHKGSVLTMFAKGEEHSSCTWRKACTFRQVGQYSCAASEEHNSKRSRKRSKSSVSEKQHLCPPLWSGAPHDVR